MAEQDSAISVAAVAESIADVVPAGVDADALAVDLAAAAAEVVDDMPVTPLLDRKRQLQGYRINKMAMGLGQADNRAAFLADEPAYLDRFGLSEAEKSAVLRRDWRELVRMGGNLFFILKISAVDPVRITEIGAHQVGMEHNDFLRDRLGKKVPNDG